MLVLLWSFYCLISRLPCLASIVFVSFQHITVFDVLSIIFLFIFCSRGCHKMPRKNHISHKGLNCQYVKKQNKSVKEERVQCLTYALTTVKDKAVLSVSHGVSLSKNLNICLRYEVFPGRKEL